MTQHPHEPLFDFPCSRTFREFEAEENGIPYEHFSPPRHYSFDQEILLSEGEEEWRAHISRALYSHIIRLENKHTPASREEVGELKYRVQKLMEQVNKKESEGTKYV